MITIKRLILSTLVAAGLLFLAGAYLLYMPIFKKGTNVAFQSSDGKWAAKEVLIKGHTFQDIVVMFMAYKIECNAPHVTLQRITRKPPWYSPYHYYNNYRDLKWLVHFAEANEHNRIGTQPPLPIDQCLRKGISDETINEARNRAQQYIVKLSNRSRH